MQRTRRVLGALGTALAAGAFIYIAGADLIPELHRATDWRSSTLQFLAVVAGFAVMAALLAID